MHELYLCVHICLVDRYTWVHFYIGVMQHIEFNLKMWYDTEFN